MKEELSQIRKWPREIDAVLFDLDGTLVSSELDFAAIRREAGLPPGPILEYMEQAGTAEKARVALILERHEEKAAHRCNMCEGTQEVLALLRTHRIKTCILTRNSRKSAATVLTRHSLDLDGVIAREDAPPKPSPEPVYAACRLLGVSAARALVVGDFVFDIESGRRAGARTVLVKLPGRDYAGVAADYNVDSLTELLPILRSLVGDGGQQRTGDTP
jgi:HAD superfamily hydrolase (TIGR01509 family)